MMKHILSFLFTGLALIGFTQPYNTEEGGKPYNDITKAAGCIPPSHTTSMEFNNVRMLVHTAGNMWQVQNQNRSVYEVPKNSNIMALFTSALWLGGTDVNDQLKLAALRYRNGADYWTGPLSQGDANVDSDVCLEYDQHYITLQDDVRNFVAWFDAGIRDAENGTNEQSEAFPEYEVPRIIKEWPAHGDVSRGQDYYLAPFFDRNEDGNYDYLDGDYPWFDLNREKDCYLDRRVSLYGDLNYWWVMNDKGNIHTETGAEPIGMEIRGQAFAFATNDEVNNMTFYNYELINRGSLTLFNTYFGFFTDGALGDPYDDYVGCDVTRGLAYYYNGDNFDGDNVGFFGYGNSPPAVGVDFFEGPYQDNDGEDNAIGIGPGEALNGIGYGDGIVDNERFGMRRFLYYSNNTNGADPSQTDPISASDYYNYLRGIWKDGTPFYYGGSGHISDDEANPQIPCDFMFPGDTDPLGWGTGGKPQDIWTEQTAGNVPNDRRFVQSAGPFVLTPGAVNNITVGVVYARAAAGDPFASVETLRRADDKAQALFENCFRIIDAPHAPDLSIQELENELILYISNPINSNNYKEQYVEFDPFIVADDPDADKNYRFQGYQIYQLASDQVSPSDLTDITKARLVAQCDIEDSISRIVNFEFDEVLQASIPIERVLGENKGIRHSFRVTEDQFALGDRKLVNFKRYYYMAVAYAYNNYKPFKQDDPNFLDGQKQAYLQSRKAPVGEIKAVEATPHLSSPENGGTVISLPYGSSPKITRLDGTGNGGLMVDLTTESEEKILQNGFLEELEYAEGAGPINVKVIDPLNVVPGYFELAFIDYDTDNTNSADTAKWEIRRFENKGDAEPIESISSELTIANDNEQLIPQWGISVQILQRPYEVYNESDGKSTEFTTFMLDDAIKFADSSKQWMRFVEDQSGFDVRNWIRSGITSIDSDDNPWVVENGFNNPQCYPDEDYDQDGEFGGILGGGMAPHALVGYQCDFQPMVYYRNTPQYPAQAATPSNGRISAGIAFSPSIDIVITADQSKWTKCPVIELGRDPSLNIGEAKPGARRKSSSVKKDGTPDSGTGMGWFPGYAIDVETGARLYMAFGENSFLANDGGADMIWNPSSEEFSSIGNPKLGGMQAFYVFSYKSKTINGNSSVHDLGAYDENNHELEQLYTAMEGGDFSAVGKITSALTWIGFPLLQSGQELLSTDVRIKLRINKTYKDFVVSNRNDGRPMYGWNMTEYATQTGQDETLAEALKAINIVPNPYYARSEYERSKIDTRAKLTNLPEQCNIRIYSTNGRLVREYRKDSKLTYLDWDLNNHAGIPVASGIYLIHIEVPGIGERILKFFMAAREVDLHGF